MVAVRPPKGTFLMPCACAGVLLSHSPTPTSNASPPATLRPIPTATTQQRDLILAIGPAPVQTFDA
jgi:hypothetical protein